MSRILCIIDGMNDFSFCYQKYPTLASFPIKKYINTVPDGCEPETLPCVLSLLGISSPPRNIRGWIEALGANLTVDQGDLIFRGSWVELSDDGVCEQFCKAPINFFEFENVKYISLGDYRGLLILPGYAHLVESINLPMSYDVLGEEICDISQPNIPALTRIITRLNAFETKCRIIPWSPSTMQSLPGFTEKAAVVCGTNVVKGIAKAMNMDVITTAAMTGDVDTDLEEKLFATLNAAESYPFVLLHIGGCDEASHRLDREQKERFLTKIDEIVLPELLKSDHRTEVVSDHGSDPKTGKHVDGKQPMFVSVLDVVSGA